MARARRSWRSKQRFAVMVLWLTAICSALAVVAVTHNVRQRLHELELLRKEAVQLQVAWGQYLLERSAWGAYSRIEKEAVEQLQMQSPEGKSLIIVAPGQGEK